ncbi:MAG: TonB-dependent receptor [Calditrichaeota bacterium]|nr:MAG: TonB-dependent receptor [Calditrichota bacterium]
MRNFSFPLIAIITLLFFSLLYGGTTGKIVGRVVDADTNEPLPGANVQLVGTTLGAATDLNGNFVILNVPPGIYTVKISFIGYQTVELKGVRVNVDFTTRINQKLKPSAVEMSAVEVYAERNPLVREDLTNTLVAVTKDVINQLPVDQINDVISLQAGVIKDNSGALHIRGGRSNEIAYQVNGISIVNPFNNLQGVGIATNAVEEVSLSAGTFSAEYGNALSGVINFVTKDGGPDYSGSFKFWTGDHVSSRDDIFFNIGDFDPLNHTRIEWTFGGPMPIFGKKFTFFTSGVREVDDGYLYGIRVYNPDEILFIDQESFVIDPLGNGRADGDRKIVPMNTRESLNLTGKFTWKPSTKFKLTYDLILDDGERFPVVQGGVNIFRRFRFNPDGRAKTFNNGTNHSIGITHTLSSKTFYTLKLGIGFIHERTYAFKDPFDPRYVPSFEGRITNNLFPQTDFIAGGTDLRRNWFKSRTLTAKLDVVSQVHPDHELKFGAEFQHHRLEAESYTLLYRVGDEKPLIPYPFLNPEFTDYQYYKRKPVQAAIYFLDKMEIAKTFILNIGARYEFLHTRALYNPDLAGTVDTGVDKNLVRSSPKHRLAPRISLSFPITDRGIIRFSYGHFYQNPTFISIFTNPRFEDLDFNAVPTFGNANLNPERSVQYEVGLQQQFTEDLKIDLTVFYKDVTNLIQVRRVFAGEVALDKEFNVVTNISYANVRGFTFSLLKRKSPGGLLSATLDYTFQIGEGAFDDPLLLALDARSGRATEQKFVPLDFDRTHTLNATLILSKDNDWAFSAIGNLWTGTPYTPRVPSSVQPVRFEVNSARRPLQKNVDLKFEKFFHYKGMRASLFVQINNAFDFKNERFVWSSTGRSLTALEETINPTRFDLLRQRIQRDPDNFFPVRFLDNFFKREDWLGPPREVRWGLTFDF